MRNTRSTIRMIAVGGIIAALYIALTFMSSALGLSSGFIQLRLSEALCILPIFTPAAIPGLFVGCLIGNLITGSVITDIIVGSLATLIGAFGTYFARKNRYVAIVPPILANTLFLPFVFVSMLEFPEHSILWYMASVFISEFVMIALLGSLLYRALENYSDIFNDVE